MSTNSSLADAYDHVVSMLDTFGPEYVRDECVRLSARHRQMHGDDLDFERIARLLGPARPVDAGILSEAEPDRVT